MLVFVLAFSAVALTSCSNKKTTTAEPSTPATNSPTESGTVSTTPSGVVDNTPTPEDIMTKLDFSATTDKEHTPAESIPSSSTLVGSTSLPGAFDRGTINCMSSVVVTYMQFSNAVARYLNAKDPTVTWTPSTDSKYCFSPRYTYIYADYYSADYDVLLNNGCLTLDQDQFDTNKSGTPRLAYMGVLSTQSVRWRADTAAIVEEALQYRLTGYSSKSLSNKEEPTNKTLENGGGFYDLEAQGTKVTYGTNGAEFLKKIKDAVVTGNVVAIRGYIHDANAVTLTAGKGLAKSGDTVIAYFSTSTEVSYTADKATADKGTDANGKPYKYSPLTYFAIVGYDDSIVVEANGGKMTGAFQVYGTNPETGKDGFFFISYDALNTISEDEKFDKYFGVDPEKETPTVSRYAGLDFIMFVYWDINIADTLPSLYAEVEVELTNRDAINVIAYRSDAFGRTTGFTTAATAYRKSRPNDYVNSTNTLRDYVFSTDGSTYTKAADGSIEGTPTTAYFVVNMDRLLTNIIKGTDYTNYHYGIAIDATDKGAPITVKSITVKSGKTELNKLTFKNETLNDEVRYYAFDAGTEVAKSYLNGSYYLKNIATGEYLIKDSVMTVKPGTLHDGDTNKKCTCTFNISYDAKLDAVLLYRHDSSADAAAHYVLDAMKDPTPGAPLQFNAQADKNNATQRWNVSYNEDDTVTFYIKNAQGHNYALGIVDGQVCLVKAMELTDNIKWHAEMVYADANTVRINTYAEATADGVAITGSVNSTKVTNVTLKIFDATTGAEVSSEKVALSEQTFEKTVKLNAGNYIVRVYDGNSTALVAKSFSLLVTVK